MSEFAKGCLALCVSNLCSLAIALWLFDSRAAREVVVIAAIGFNISMIVRLVGIWRRERSNQLT